MYKSISTGNQIELELTGHTHTHTRTTLWFMNVRGLLCHTRKSNWVACATNFHIRLSAFLLLWPKSVGIAHCIVSGLIAFEMGILVSAIGTILLCDKQHFNASVIDNFLLGYCFWFILLWIWWLSGAESVMFYCETESCLFRGLLEQMCAHPTCGICVK